MIPRKQVEASFLEIIPKHFKERPKLLVTLADLKPESYVDTVVKIIFIKSREKKDELGERPYIFGLAEDSTFRAPFVCYKPSQVFFRDSVFKFENAYVHEFDDHSIILILGEYSKVRMLPEESLENYDWQPTVGSITRPLGRGKVTLEGVVSTIYRSSGLVRRCEKCSQVISEEKCPKCGEDTWFWSVRVSSKLSDKTGSINTIFSQYLACKLLGKPISDILCIAKIPQTIEHSDFNAETFQVKPPESLTVNESTVVDPLLFRQCSKLIVPDNKKSKIYSPLNVSVVSSHIIDVKQRILKFSNEEDRAIYVSILEKALDIEIRRRNKLPKLHGIYLMEEPVTLFNTEGAKLYLGFELSVNPTAENIEVDFYPSGLIRESVLDYIQWRRGRGASPNGIRNALLDRKKNVILAPNGTIGSICEVRFEDTGSYCIPALNIPLPQFWKTTYDIDVKPDEKPLLIIKPYNLDVELTYPPSCVYFDEQSLYIRNSIRKFIDYKKSQLRNGVFDLAKNLLMDLKIDQWHIDAAKTVDLRVDAKRVVLNDIKQKLLGKSVKATGTIVQKGERLYFFPNTIEGVW